MYVCRLCTISIVHGANSLLSNAINRASPSSMHSTYGLLASVVEQYGNAIGCRYAYADLWAIGHHGINTFDSFCWWSGDATNGGAVNLMRNDELLNGNI